MWLGVGKAILHAPYTGRNIEVKIQSGNRSSASEPDRLSGADERQLWIAPAVSRSEGHRGRCAVR
jgi:hypothetical protein